jgi:hypothetical protein
MPQPCAGTDCWFRSEWFPQVVYDLVGKDALPFWPARPRLGDSPEHMTFRRVELFLPQAADSPSGLIWQKVEDNLDKVDGSWMEKQATLPFHQIYVYSSEFLASVQMLFYEVLLGVS